MPNYLALGLALFGATAASAQATKPLYQNRTAPTEARVSDLLARMTVEEKWASSRPCWAGKCTRKTGTK